MQDILHCLGQAKLLYLFRYLENPLFHLFFFIITQQHQEAVRHAPSHAFSFHTVILKRLTKMPQNPVAFFKSKQLSDQIEYAYQNHEFVVYYQPKYDSRTKKLAGAEALVRWRRRSP